MVDAKFKAYLEMYWNKESKKMLSALKGMGGDGAAFDDDWIESLSRSLASDIAAKFGKADFAHTKQATDFLYGKLSRMDLSEAKMVRDADYYWPATLYKFFKKKLKKKKYWWAFAPFYGKGAGYTSQATMPKGQVIGTTQPGNPSGLSPAYPGAGGINAPGVPGGGANAGMGPISASKVYRGSSLFEVYDFMKVSRKQFVENKQKTILVVDDASELAALIAQSLESAGAKVLLFTDPRKAIAEIGHNKSIDIVCTDFRMPSINPPNGDDVMHAAKKAGVKKVVLISGTKEDTQHPNEYALILEKPAGLRELKKVVHL